MSEGWGAISLELAETRITYMEQILKEWESYGKYTYNFLIWGISMTLPHWKLSPFFTLSIALMDSTSVFLQTVVKNGTYCELLSSRSRNNQRELRRKEGCIISARIKISSRTRWKKVLSLSPRIWNGGSTLFPEDLHEGVMLMSCKEDSVSGHRTSWCLHGLFLIRKNSQYRHMQDFYLIFIFIGAQLYSFSSLTQQSTLLSLFVLSSFT